MFSKYQKFVSVMCLSLGSQIAWADASAIKADATPSALSSWLVTFSMGSAWENGGASQTLDLTPEIVKTYDANYQRHSLAVGELFVGVQRPLSKHFQGQLGLAVVATDSAPLAGDIWDDADPQFDNATYNYSVQHSHIALKAKLLVDADPVWTPWLSASAGLGFNRAYGFSNTPTSSETLETPNFSSQTTTSFTYTLGVGVEHALSEQWKIGIGYEFSDWGKSALGPAPGQTQGSGPSLNHLYTDSILANITYFI